MKKIEVSIKTNQKKHKDPKIGSVVERINELGKPVMLPPMDHIRSFKNQGG